MHSNSPNNAFCKRGPVHSCCFSQDPLFPPTPSTFSRAPHSNWSALFPPTRKDDVITVNRLFLYFASLGVISQYARVHAIPYMEGVNYVRSNFLHRCGSHYILPERFIYLILRFYNNLYQLPHGFHA